MDYQLEQLKTLLVSCVSENGAGFSVGPLLRQVNQLVKTAQVEKLSSAEAKKKVLDMIDSVLKGFPPGAVGVADKIKAVLLPAVDASFGSLDAGLAGCFSWVSALFSRKKAILSSFETVVPLNVSGLASTLQASLEEPKAQVSVGEVVVVEPVESLVVREVESVLQEESLVDQLVGKALKEMSVKGAVEKMD
jgi:hypothetical protein